MRPLIGRTIVICALFASARTAVAQSGDATMAALIEPVRQEFGVPALGAAILTSRGLSASAVVGVRKRGTNVAATVNDAWHLGSDTKAMTAVIIAKLVESGTLTWGTTIGDVYKDRAASFPADFRTITITHLLSHHAGLEPNLNWRSIERSRAPLTEQRFTAVLEASSRKLSAPPGTKFEYSNLGYVLAGAIAERVTGKPWETLMREMIFAPLGMTGCGFGGTGTIGQIDQPWPHGDDGSPRAENGPLADNAAVLGPAGTVHCPLADWAKFVVDQLRGERGDSALLKRETYKMLHTPKFGGSYAFGWGVTKRAWAGGTAFSHAGSNTMNYAVVWIGPGRDIAYLAVTNQAGMAASNAADRALAALITARAAAGGN
jgi:CubicO group peptidase (beta-lactamase class C family)